MPPAENQQQLRSPACGQIECKDDISAFHWYSDNSKTFFFFILEGVMYEFDCVKVKRFGATAFVGTLNWRRHNCSREKVFCAVTQLRLPADARRLLGAAADPSVTAPPLASIYASVRLRMCFFPRTGRAYLYANEVPVTFKGRCLNSGKDRETALFVWM